MANITCSIGVQSVRNKAEGVWQKYENVEQGTLDIAWTCVDVDA